MRIFAGHVSVLEHNLHCTSLRAQQQRDVDDVERANGIKWLNEAQSRFTQDLKGNTSNKEKGKALASKEDSKPGNNVKCSGQLL
jgi:hypothetical protein